jgi:hypothetical protein
MANLNAFVNRLAGGGARANQFEVTLTGIGVLTENFSFLCRTAQMPAMTLGEVTVPYRGRQVFLAGDRTYDAWTVTVFNDANWQVRSGLETWMHAIADIGSSTTAMGTGYYGTANVRQLNREGTSVWGASLYNVWPTTIDAVELAYDTNDAVEEYGVTFRFNYMTTGPVVGVGIGSV